MQELRVELGAGCGLRRGLRASDFGLIGMYNQDWSNNFCKLQVYQ